VRLGDPARVLNLDTNHVSDLVRRQHAVDVRGVLELLERGEAALGFSHLHVAQLAAPEFVTWPALRDLLREVPTVLLQPREDVFEEEAICATMRAIGERRRPPRVIARDTSEWGRKPGPPGGDVVIMVDAFRELDESRHGLLRMGEHYAASVQMKERAYVMRHPLGPLTLMVEDHLRDMRTRIVGYARGVTASEVVQASGGLAAFPAYQVNHELLVYTLRLPSVKGRPGDLADEYIASYAPYVAVTALDRATAHRVREVRLSCAPRVTARLADVPALFQRVQSGALKVVPSHW
jgi:hypothetical protein